MASVGIFAHSLPTALGIWMGAKPRTARTPKFSPGDRKSAEAVIEYWREIIRRRDKFVAAIAESPNRSHPRAQRKLDQLDAVLAEYEYAGRGNIRRALPHHTDYGTAFQVNAVEVALASRTSWTLEDAARECGVEIVELNAAIASKRVQGKIPQRGKSMLKAAYEVVAILNGESASSVRRRERCYAAFLEELHSG